jgi:Arc/MetJ family transcription regulator
MRFSTGLQLMQPGQLLKRAAQTAEDGQSYTPKSTKVAYRVWMGRTNIEIDENLIRKARKLTRLKAKRQIVTKALELLVRSETRKGLLRYYGSGVWSGDLQGPRRNRV